MKTEHKNIYLWMMVFRKVAKHKSFTIAADHLRMTKSGVSQHVSKLEKHLGVQLLIRSTRSLSLTSAGKKLFVRVGELKVLLDVAVDETQGIKEQPSGYLSITAPQALFPSVILPSVYQMVKQFPAIKPQLIAADNNQDIVKKGIDIAIRVGDLEDSDLKIRKIGSLSEIFVASSAYMASQAKPITRQNIDRHAFIATSWQIPKFKQQLIDKKKGGLLELYFQSAYEVNSANTAIELVMLDLGIALLPKIYVEKWIKEGKLQQVLVDLETRGNDIHYLHAYKKEVPLKVKWFNKFLAEQLQL